MPEANGAIGNFEGEAILKEKAHSLRCYNQTDRLTPEITMEKMQLVCKNWVILTRVLGLPQSIEIDKRPGKKFRQIFIGVPVAEGRSENK